MNTTLYNQNILLEGEEKVFKIVPERITNNNSDLGKSVRGIETEKVKQINKRPKNVMVKNLGGNFILV